MQRTLFGLGSIFALTPWSTPASTLLMGILLALSLGNPYPQLTKKYSRLFLQASVIGLGFGMDFPRVLEVGRSGILFSALSILGAFLLGEMCRRLLRVPLRLSLLLSSGTAICGGSAIAAVSAVVAASSAEVAAAIGVTFLLNALALYIFPPFGHLFALSQAEFGTWAGIAIHDVSSVVGAATSYGEEALEIATAVKLARALWIVPLTLSIGYLWRKIAEKSQDSEMQKKPAFPWFILFFLFASLSRGVHPFIAEQAPVLTLIAKKGFSLTLFLIGLGISREALKAVGFRAFLQSVLLWIGISLGSLVFILLNR